MVHTAPKHMRMITHARRFLKERLRAGDCGPEPLAVFRKWYRKNDHKLELLMQEHAVLSIGRNTEKYNSVCYKVNGQPISKDLSRPAPQAQIAVALRHAE